MKPADRIRRYYRKIEEEYCFRYADIFVERSERLEQCVKALSFLSEDERRLFILYAETGSLEKLSRIIGISKSTLQYRIFAIRKKIKDNIRSRVVSSDTSINQSINNHENC